MRYRLRFHLQEIDLAGDEIIIGRGAMGHITIDDPMLSRRHVRIDLSGSAPTVEDLRSRANLDSGTDQPARLAVLDNNWHRQPGAELVVNIGTDVDLCLTNREAFSRRAGFAAQREPLDKIVIRAVTVTPVPINSFAMASEKDKIYDLDA